MPFAILRGFGSNPNGNPQPPPPTAIASPPPMQDGPPPLNPPRSEEASRPALRLGANDGPVDDFIELVEGWEAATGHSLFPSTSEPLPPDLPPVPGDGVAQLLGHIAEDFSPTQMRQLGESLIKLADSLDQMWHPHEVRSSYHWITTAGRIERQALGLAQVAMRMRKTAKDRAQHLSPEFLGEPYWEMLLELFTQFAGGAKVSTKSLCIASGVPDTTALRMIDNLEDACLVDRSISPLDRRVTLVGLTKQGVVAVGSILLQAGR
jgi:DNA-binding MarR family transcriptional regulator